MDTKKKEARIAACAADETGICPYSTRLRVYDACSSRRRFCPAGSLIPSESGLPFSLAEIKRQADALPAGSVVRLGDADCFPPREKETKRTAETIEYLNARGIHYLIVTRSDLVASDEYVRVLNRRFAHIQIAIPATNDDLRTFEDAPAPSLRIRAAEKLYALGFDVTLRLSPYLPDAFDPETLRAVRCEKLLVEFPCVKAGAPRTPAEVSLYAHEENGCFHLPLPEKKRALQNLLRVRQISVCDPCEEAAEYWKYHVNRNPKDCCDLTLDNAASRPLGDASLLRLQKVAFLSSRVEYEGTADRVFAWVAQNVNDDACVVSGFQSELERKMLDVLLRTDRRLILVLSGKMPAKCPEKLSDAVKRGRALLLAPFDTDDPTPDPRLAAERRNAFVLRISDRILAGDVSTGGMLESLLRSYPNGKRLDTFGVPDPYDEE